MPLFWISRRVKCAKAPFGHDFDKPPVTDQLRLHHRRKIADADTATAAVIAAIAAAVSAGDCKRGSSKRFEDFSACQPPPDTPAKGAGAATGADAGAPLAAPVTAAEGHSDLA